MQEKRRDSFQKEREKKSKNVMTTELNAQ
jgi:hypothetical protein